MRRATFAGMTIVLMLSTAVPQSAGAAPNGTPAATDRVSVSSTGTEGNNLSSFPSMSDAGRFVAFTSDASDLVRADTNGRSDVFVYDRATHRTRRVSVTSTGAQGNDASFDPSISADGRFVVFNSLASNLVVNDTNGNPDAFVYDRDTRTTQRVSVDSAGGQANSGSWGMSISADGQLVTFYSSASNLVRGDANGAWDAFLYDRSTHKTRLISVGPAGAPGDSVSYAPLISSDGRYVTFTSSASNLVQGDTNSAPDVFLYDRSTGKIRRISVNTAGRQSNGGSWVSSITTHGRFVAFTSNATNLVHADTDNYLDVFVYDRATRETQRVSVNSSATQGNSGSFDPTLSPRGRFVAFTSQASNLVGNDTNGFTDVFVYDRLTNRTRRVSVDSTGGQADGTSSHSSIAAHRFVSFESEASNLVDSDTNTTGDVFVRGPLY